MSRVHSSQPEHLRSVLCSGHRGCKGLIPLIGMVASRMVPVVCQSHSWSARYFSHEVLVCFCDGVTPSR